VEAYEPSMRKKTNGKTRGKGKGTRAVKSAPAGSPDQVQDGFLVAGIGSSAGGVEALRIFFKHAPVDSGIAFIVAQHLSPDRKSMLSAILAQSTKMAVAEIQEGVPIAPNRVYVVPPGVVATIDHQRFKLTPAAGSPRHPIDSLFESLGTELGVRAAAVVLSGLGNDGSRGVKAVREHGGLVIAQGTDSTAPQHDDMPRGAIATGMVDFVLPVQHIPDALGRHADHLSKITTSGRKPVADGAESQFQALFGLLQKRAGHDFRNYKRNTFARRVQRRMQVVRVESLEKYIATCEKDPSEVDKLFDDLLIGVTHFFRDTAAFNALAQTVIPQLFEGKSKDDQVRIWVPGCSTGEEVYSIAILLREHMAALETVPKVQIFASDIDEHAVEIARAGRYGKEVANDVTSERLARFFHPEETHYRLSKDVRELCIFSVHSVIKNPPYSRLDLVSCRNLLIYFDSALQNRLVPLFHYALKPGGYLFLGPSENISRHTDLFATLDKKHRILRRRETGRRVLPDFTTVPSELHKFPVPRELQPDHHGQIVNAAERILLERHLSPFVVIDQDLNVVHFSAGTGKYLETPAGAPERNLLALGRRGLGAGLRSVTGRGVQSDRQVATADAHMDGENGRVAVRLTARPLGPSDGETNLTMLIFQEIASAAAPATAQRGGDRGAIEQLEAELRLARDSLQSTIEEYETSSEELKSSNEELLSINEEMQSTNEELETSKEELQSLNEELQTINQEVTAKIEEIDRANADLKNLIDSTDIATLFLDRNLAVRNFTPTLTRIFRLIRSDIGRPIQDIVHGILDPVALEADMREVLHADKPLQREVKLTGSDDVYAMRIHPYRDARGKPQGIVLTFVDISTLKKADRQRLLLIDELNHRVKNILAVAMSIAGQMLRTFRSPDEFRDAYFGRLQILAKANELVSLRDWNGAKLGDIIALELSPYLQERPTAVSVDGPPVVLRSRGALTVGLAVHELVTNAAKYGALGKPGMTLDVGWTLDGGNDLVIRWDESGGKDIKPPAASGFGMTMVHRVLTQELSAKVDADFRPVGLRCLIRIPASALLLAGASEHPHETA
jgi:two-component system, chemotaxis family, CheB/CheR fusion protein